MSGDSLSVGSQEPTATGLAFAMAGRLPGQQRALLRALEGLDHASELGDYSLASMYQGGLVVLEDSGNPDRFAQCAHSMRELMEKISEHLGVPMKAQGESLGVKARDFSDAYDRARTNTECFSESNGWHGTVDRPLQKFLREADFFFDWFESHRPRRQEENA